MKNLTLLFLFCAFGLQAQNVNIPDANFKSTLLANTAINTNSDDEIQVSEAESYSGSLHIDRSKGVISDFTGLEAFLNLSELGLEGHSMTSLDLTTNNKLERLTLGSLELIKNATLPENSILNFIQINNTYGISSLDFSKALLLKDLEIAMGSPSILDLSKNTNLERLSVSESPINYLNLSNNPMLQILSLTMSGGLKTIDLSGATNLKTVSISDSYSIEQLDFSNNSKLTQLSISEENLSSLNVKNGNNINLSLSVSSPILKCVIVDNPTWSKANWSTKFPKCTQFSFDCVPGPIVNIPDSVFKNILLTNSLININCDEEIQVSEAEAFNGKLVVNDDEKSLIKSLVGLEAFVGLKNLELVTPNLTLVDLTNNLNLETLHFASATALESLDLSHNKLLKFLTFDFSKVNSFIDLSENTELEGVDVIMSEIGGLNVTNCKKLNYLRLLRAGINSLDLSQNPLLENLEIIETSIPTLDLTHNPNLKRLHAEGLFNVSEVDLSKNGVLNDLFLIGDSLSYLNLKNGNNLNLTVSVSSSKLKCVIVDDPVWSNENWSSNFPQGIQFSLDCESKQPIVNIGDGYFKSILLANSSININGDDEIQVSEAEAYTGKIEVIEDRNNPIFINLNGLESFINIKELEIESLNPSPIDLSKNVNLEILRLATSDFGVLDFSKNINLKKIDLNYANYQNSILDFSSQTELEELTLRLTRTDSINLLNCKKLKSLTIELSENNLKEINLTQNIALEYLKLEAAGIQKLDLSKNINLKKLEASYINFSELDLSQNIYLESLNLFFLDKLSYLNLKNGNNKNLLVSVDIYSASLLKCVIVDDPAWSKANWPTKFPQCTQFSLDCIPEPIVNIPDSVFKYILLSNTLINTNCDEEIQVSEAEAFTGVLVISEGCCDKIMSVVGIEAFTNIKELEVTGLQVLSELDLSKNLHLEKLFIESDGISSVNISQNKALKTLKVSGTKINGFMDLSENTELEYVEFLFTPISGLNISKCEKIKKLVLDSVKNISVLDVTHNIFLEELIMGEFFISKCDLTQNLNLKKLVAVNMHLIYEIDLSKNPQLNYLTISSDNLTYVNIKNGKEHWFGAETFYESNVRFDNNPNLKYICADESEIIPLKNYLNQIGLPNCEVNSYCTFTPGGEFYTLKGKLTSCDAEEFYLPNVKYAISNGTNTGYFIADATGNYSITVTDKTHLITPKSEYSEYFEITPAFANIEFSDEQKVIEQDFCIKNIKEINDVEIVISPIEVARPGFDADYQILYTNKGTTTSKGTVEFFFEDSILDYLGATAGALVTEGKVSWNYEGLKPFETRKLYVKFNLNSPMEIPAVNNDDILKFTARINTEVEDTTPKDNQFDLHQTVVGSFDPNDKTCLEGEVITPDMIGNYLHYKIRFENTGTFAAENVVIEDDIDTTKFDISSLVVLEGSHSFVTKIEGNKVKFIFEKINLPFDDATNDGYVLFKIKTLPSLKLNDSFSNSAKIYFDFNFPIETNLATTTVKENIGLSVKDFEFSDQFSLYPNPTNHELNISAKTKSTITSMEIYNTIGQILLAIPNAQNTQKIDVSFLPNGTYILKANTSNGVSTIKFVKE